MLQTLYNTNKTLYFIFLCLVTLLLLFAKKAFVEYETTAFIILDQKGEMGFFKALSALQYISIPIVYLYKFTLISFVLWVGSFLFGYRITYAKMFGIAIVAESVFLLPEAIKIVWFMFGTSEVTFYDIRAFYPLSLMNLVDYKEVADKFHYPLKALNIFEVLYWWVLIRLIHYVAGKKIQIASLIVLTSYVLFFLIWLAFYAAVYK